MTDLMTLRIAFRPNGDGAELHYQRGDGSSGAIWLAYVPQMMRERDEWKERAEKAERDRDGALASVDFERARATGAERGRDKYAAERDAWKTRAEKAESELNEFKRLKTDGPELQYAREAIRERDEWKARAEQAEHMRDTWRNERELAVAEMREWRSRAEAAMRELRGESSNNTTSPARARPNDGGGQ